MGERANQVGVASVQAMVYFLARTDVIEQEFSLYNYGPCSSDVTAELKRLRDVLDVSWDPHRGYSIRLASNTNLTEPETRAKEAIDHLVEKLGGKTPKELSLIATVLYFHGKLPGDRIVETVRSLRPQFSEKEVLEAVKTVKEVFG